VSEWVPDHSSLTVIRQRLPPELHEEVVAFVLRILVEHGLYDAKTLAVNATMLEANAASSSRPGTTPTACSSAAGRTVALRYL
jgi:transposase